jgi:uncharacterized membrane protein
VTDLDVATTNLGRPGMMEAAHPPPLRSEFMTSTEKSSTGLEPNLAAALSYVLPPITGVIFFAMEKESRFVRYHAMQSILVGLAALAVWIVYGVLVNILLFIPILGWIAIPILWAILTLSLFVLWVFLMIKAFQGDRYKLPYLGDIAEKQSEKPGGSL